MDVRKLGFDPDRLDRIGRFLQARYLDTGLLPHARVRLARDDEVALDLTLGQAREDGTPLKPDAIFRIASMTKPLTSLAYMMLVEEGATALDHPVSRVIPEFEGLGVYAGGGADGEPFAPTTPCAPMRMVDLLRHTSGLTYGLQRRTPVDAAYRRTVGDGERGRHDDAGFIAAVAALPLEFAPGTAFNYSVSTDVLGVAVSRLEGRPLGEVLRERILKPLGMVDTAFACSPAKRHRLTDAWGLTAPGRPREVIDAAATTTWDGPARFESGGAGLLSTAADYHRFCRMLLGRGGVDGARLVSPKTLDLMTANHLPGGGDLNQMSRSLFSEATLAGTGFGLGFALLMDPAPGLIPGTPGEFYWGGLYSTVFFVDPVERLSLVFMTQLAPSSAYPIRRELRTLVYSALTRSYAG